MAKGGGIRPARFDAVVRMTKTDSSCGEAGAACPGCGAAAAAATGTAAPRLSNINTSTEINTETTTQTSIFEFTIGTVGGGVNFPQNVNGTITMVFNGQVVLNPALSTEVLIEPLARFLADRNVSRDTLREAFASINGSLQGMTLQSVSTEQQTSSSFFPSSCMGVGSSRRDSVSAATTGMTGDGHETIIVESEELEEDPGVSADAEVKTVIDENGNIKVMFKLVRMIRKKTIQVKHESSPGMAKACTFTVFCALVIIIVWIVLDATGTEWFSGTQ